MCGPNPCQPDPGRFFEFPDMIGMDAPRQTDETKQGQNEVMFIVADAVQYERSTFTEQIPPQGKNSRPGESAHQVYPEKCAGGKIGYPENYRQNNSESVGEPGDERHIIPVFFDQLERFTELSGDEVETFEQPLPFEAPEVKIKLIPKERACPGGKDDTQNTQIPLKGKKSGKEEDRFTFKKGSNEQHPVSVKLQVLPENLLNMHLAAPVVEYTSPDKQDKCVNEVIFCLNNAENNF